jgi:hypothetical protein
MRAIIQIATGESVLFALTETGELYARDFRLYRGNMSGEPLINQDPWVQVPGIESWKGELSDTDNLDCPIQG